MPEKCFEYNKLITYADYTGGRTALDLPEWTAIINNIQSGQHSKFKCLNEQKQLNPFFAHCCHMGTAIKHSVLD